MDLDFDGRRVPFPLSEVSVHSGFLLPAPETAEQAAELLLKILVEVEIDEGLVDVGGLGKEGSKQEACGGHVLVPFDKEEEGHNGRGEPGDHEAQGDEAKHLEEDEKKSACEELKRVPIKHAETLVLMSLSWDRSRPSP